MSEDFATKAFGSPEAGEQADQDVTPATDAHADVEAEDNNPEGLTNRDVA